MSRILVSDRRLLGDAGLALDIEAYAQTVAGAGLYSLIWMRSSGHPSSFVGWGPRLWDHDPLSRDWLPGTLRNFRKAWLARRNAEAPIRIAIDASGQDRSDEPDVLAIARVLSLPVLEARSVFISPSWMRSDIRWQWPMRIAAWGEDLEALELAKLATQWPAKSLSRIHAVARDRERNEILVVRGTVRSALQRVLASPFPLRAAHVVLLGPLDLSWRDVVSPLQTLLAELQAGGLSWVPVTSSGRFLDALLSLARELSHNEPFDIALRSAFISLDAVHVLNKELIHAAALPTAMRTLARRFQALPRGVAIDLPEATRGRIDLQWESAQSPGMLARELAAGATTFPYARESEGGSAAVELSDAERTVRRNASTQEAPRTVQADLFEIRDGEARKHTQFLRQGAAYKIEVFIAPEGEGELQADDPFPDSTLEWSARDEFTLGVLFAEANQWDEVQRGQFTLPRYGASERCTFSFTPIKTGPFRARLTIFYRQRVLQTALLETVVVGEDVSTEGEAPRLKIETLLRRSLATLDDRQRFDACLVLNQTVANRPALQAGGEGGAYIASLDPVTSQLEKISARLHDVALDARRYSKGLKTKESAALLVDLATEGNLLYRNLVLDYVDRSTAAKALRESEYLQIVATKSDATVPLELVYEYKPPAPGAPVCPNAAKALREGKCPGCVPTVSPAPHVCPLGFWGLSKVIERHVHDPSLSHVARIDGVEPIVGREELSLSGPTLVAASRKVPAAEQRKLTSTLKSKWTRGGINPVTQWVDWPPTVQAHAPVLVLALPHSIGKDADLGLEIGGTELRLRYLDDTYVRAKPDLKPPLLILLGCDTAAAGDAKAYARHVAFFRQATAPVILGTLASVDATDAARVATKLIEHLTTALAGGPVRFGSVLRATKREAVAGGLIIALGLVGFGDADWKLRT